MNDESAILRNTVGGSLSQGRSVALADLVTETPAEGLPKMIGELATALAVAVQRLMSPPQPAMSAKGDLATADELSEEYRVPRSWFYEQARRGRLACVRLGRHVRFDRSEVERAIAAGIAPNSKRPGIGIGKNSSNGGTSQAAATGVLPGQRATKGSGRIT